MCLGLGGPPLVKATGEVVSSEDLGGGDVHTRLGVVDHLADNDTHALQLARRAVAALNRPKCHTMELRSAVEPAYAVEELYGVVPADWVEPYDIGRRS